MKKPLMGPATRIAGGIGRIVVEEDDFKGDAGERGLQAPKQRQDVVTLVEGGNDDRKRGQSDGLRGVLGARSDGFIHEGQAYICAVGGSQGGAPKPGGRTGEKTGQKKAPKCQRPRTERPRPAGAADLFGGRPSAGAISHRRRGWVLHRRDPDLPQEAISAATGYCGTSLPPGPLTAGGAGCAGCSVFCICFCGFAICPIGT